MSKTLVNSVLDGPRPQRFRIAVKFTAISLIHVGGLLWNAGHVLAQTPARAAPATKPLTLQAALAQSPGLDCSFLRERGPNAASPITAKSSPHDARLVVFPYDKNAIFPVNAFFNRFTHFEFEPGETVVASYLNDETEWEQKVSGTGTDILVRPRARGANGSMTVITSRRRYQIDLVDIEACGEPRYQRVSWQTTDGGIYEDREALARAAGTQRGNVVVGTAAAAPPVSPAQNVAADTAAPNMTVRLEDLNTDYTIEGDPELAPDKVFDDGKRTWFKFKSATVLRPAMFAVAADGTSETVEYVPYGSYFIASKLFPHGALLKAGKREVRIKNKASSCGWFDSRCRVVAPSNISGAN